MDSLITAAARALAAGDPLGALNRVALREDAPALALRGIAMAQLGDLVRAKALVRQAARAFGAKEVVARARCVVAEAEIAFAARDLHWPTKALDAARITLEQQGDHANAAHARNLEIRRLLMIGSLDAAERLLDQLDSESLPPATRATHELIIAGIAMRRIQTKVAHAALARAEHAARVARIPALQAEVQRSAALLDQPAARLISGSEQRALKLAEVETLLASRALVVDGCRHAVREARTIISLATRPVLFTLARVLAEAWPADVPRGTLITLAFRTRFADETHRARLRVEIGRLRKVLRGLATISATSHGFALQPLHARRVAVLARPLDEEHAPLLALLGDGESWSSSALALALGASQRTVQRSLDSLAAAGKVQALGRGRARRWTTPPLPGFATSLLLPGPLVSD